MTLPNGLWTSALLPTAFTQILLANFLKMGVADILTRLHSRPTALIHFANYALNM
jgi:hypothetical protein